MPMIVLDVETTGIDPKETSIVSIGAVDTNKLLNDEPEPLFYGECTIWPGARVEPKALEVNGFTEEQVKYTNDELHENMIKRYVFWAKDSTNRTLCGENVDFDIRFMKEALLRAGYAEKQVREMVGIRGIDIHTISYESHENNGITIPMKYGRSALSLDETLKYIGIPEEAKPHNGLIGAILEAEARWRIAFGQSLFSKIPIKKIIPHQFPDKLLGTIPNFANFPIPEYLSYKKHR